jgi:hypothetical protein
MDIIPISRHKLPTNPTYQVHVVFNALCMILQGIGIFGQAALKTLDRHISKD